MPKIPQSKVRLEVLIDKELNKKLREIISLKYKGYSRGLLSREVEEALWHWVRLHTQDHTKPVIYERVNPHPKVFQVFAQVKDYLRQKKKYVPQQVSYSELVEAISAVRGSDKRTIRKWISLFLQWKCIRMLAPNVYEILG